MSEIICAYCNTVNDARETTCLACGAPLEAPRPQYRPRPKPAPVEPVVTILPTRPQTEDLRIAGQKVEKVYDAVVNTYAIAWRTVGEAISIALTGFALGLIGGATGAGGAGLIGGALVGLAVGLANKMVWFAALSAPLGAFLGCLLWGLAMLFGAGPRGLVYAAMVFAGVTALVGSRSSRKIWWDYVRPFLGMAGGLAFSLLGLLIGWLLREGVAALWGGALRLP
jgi:hypothetical protein